MTRKEEVDQKRQQVRAFLREHSAEGILLTQVSNFSWYTGGGSNFVVVSSEEGVAPILVTPDQDYVIADRIEAPRIAEEEVQGLGFEIVEHAWYRSQERTSLLEKLLKGKRLTDTGEIGQEFARLRYSLNENEVERYR